MPACVHFRIYGVKCVGDKDVPTNEAMMMEIMRPYLS
jgi:hypothetical protein